MINFAEYKNEDALDLYAEIFEPVSELFGDAEFMKAWSSKNFLLIAAAANRTNHDAVLRLIKACEKEKWDNKKFGVFDLPMMLIKIFSQPDFISFGEEMQSFFASQEQRTAGTVSGNATEITEATETM